MPVAQLRVQRRRPRRPGRTRHRSAPNICTGQSAGGQNLGLLFAVCNQACATAAGGGSNAGVNNCVAAVDCINNGNTWEQVGGEFVCTPGTEQNCHNNPVFCPEGEPICFPQESAEPGDCKASRASDCTYANTDEDACDPPV